MGLSPIPVKSDGPMHYELLHICKDLPSSLASFTSPIVKWCYNDNIVKVIILFMQNMHEPQQEFVQRMEILLLIYTKHRLMEESDDRGVKGNKLTVGKWGQ